MPSQNPFSNSTRDFDFPISPTDTTFFWDKFQWKAKTLYRRYDQNWKDFESQWPAKFRYVFLDQNRCRFIVNAVHFFILHAKNRHLKVKGETDSKYLSFRNWECFQSPSTYLISIIFHSILSVLFYQAMLLLTDFVETLDNPASISTSATSWFHTNNFQPFNPNQSTNLVWKPRPILFFTSLISMSFVRTANFTC